MCQVFKLLQLVLGVCCGEEKDIACFRGDAQTSAASVMNASPSRAPARCRWHRLALLLLLELSFLLLLPVARAGRANKRSRRSSGESNRDSDEKTQIYDYGWYKQHLCKGVEVLTDPTRMDWEYSAEVVLASALRE